jgi:Tfp pilus assembly protein PilF
MALLYHKNKQPERALELVNELIDQYPAIADLYIARASLMLNNGDYQAAKADFDKAISVDPRNYQSFRARSNYYNATSSPDLARNDLNQAITLLGEDIQKNPQDAPLFLYRAEIMEETDNIAGALSEYDNYLKNWPPNLSVLINKA